MCVFCVSVCLLVSMFVLFLFVFVFHLLSVVSALVCSSSISFICVRMSSVLFICVCFVFICVRLWSFVFSLNIFIA